MKSRPSKGFKKRVFSSICGYFLGGCRVSDEPPELTWLIGERGGDAFLFAPTPPKGGWRGGEWAKKKCLCTCRNLTCRVAGDVAASWQDAVLTQSGL